MSGAETITDEQLMIRYISTPDPVPDGMCLHGTHLFMYEDRLDYHNTTIAIKHIYANAIELPTLPDWYKTSICWQDKLQLLINACVALEGGNPMSGGSKGSESG